ncbi:MAG: cytochrome c-type biogenesis protein [Pseudomonadota bacterium]
MKNLDALAVLLAAFLCLFSGLAWATTTPEEALDDPALEARARAIDTQLRCVVCKSQSIAESNAPLAEDLRKLVRERLSAGDTDEAAIDYIVARYGDYVLLKPRFQKNTVLLWVFPGIILALSVAGGLAYIRKASRSDFLNDDALGAAAAGEKPDGAVSARATLTPGEDL